MKGNGLLLRVALRPLRLCVKAGLTSVATWRLCVNCRFQVHTPRRFGRRACARWPAAMSFLAEASWLWWSLGVALVEPWGGFGGALGWLWWSLEVALVKPWGGFGEALGWLCTPESMPSIWLWCGLGVALWWLWVALPGLSAFCLLPSLGGRYFHLTGARIAEQPIGSEVMPEFGRFLPGATRAVVETHRRGQRLQSEARNAKKAPESTICGVLRKLLTTTTATFSVIATFSTP